MTLASEISNHLAIFISQNKLKKEIAQYTLSLEERITERTMTVSLPNQDTIWSTKVATLEIKNVPQEACRAHVFKKMGETALVSTGQLCDA